MSNNPEITDALWSHAQHILDAVVSTYQQYDISLPDRRYIHAGTPAHDCEQVTVSFLQLYIGPPGDQAQLPQNCDSPWTSVFSVEIARKLPTAGPRGSAPDVDALQDSAKQKLVDAYMLQFVGRYATDEWGLGVLADVTPTEPQGGFQAMVLNLITAVP